MVDYRRRETEKVRKREIKFLKGKKETQIPEFEPGLDPFEHNETVNVRIVYHIISPLIIVNV